MRDSVIASTVGAISFKTGRPARHMYTPCGKKRGREQGKVRNFLDRNFVCRKYEVATKNLLRGPKFTDSRYRVDHGRDGGETHGGSPWQ